MPSTVQTSRLVLTSLDLSDAATMVEVLSDADLYVFTGGEPPTLAQLEARYRAQLAGPEDADERWLNWIVRLRDTNQPIGFVQATVNGRHADVAWLIGSEWQRQGFAREAALAMCQWLHAGGVTHLTAHIHPDHGQSNRVAVAVGLQRSGEVDADGEQIWAVATDVP